MKEHEPRLSVHVNIGATNWDPSECTRLLQLEPTSVWHQPERMVRDGQRRSEWSYGFTKRPFDSLEEAVAEVLGSIRQHRETFRELGRREGYELSVTCVVNIFHDAPEYTLSHEVLAELAWLECEFGLDIHDYRD